MRCVQAEPEASAEQHGDDVQLRLAVAQERAEFHRQNLEALLSLSETISHASSLDEVFQSALSTAMDITGMASGGIRLLDTATQCFRLMSHQGMTPAMVQELQCIPAGVGFPAEAAATKEPVYTADLGSDRRTRTEEAAQIGYRSLVCVPLLADGQVKGTMELADHAVRTWHTADLRWLANIGREIGTAVHVVEISERMRDFAVLQERERLSRELHDGLSQIIGAIRLWAENAQFALDDGDHEGAQQAIERIESAANEAYVELREEILTLRDVVGLRGDLCSTLQEYLVRFEQRWKIKTRLTMTVPPGCSMRIAPDAEIQLLRIIQEALTNVHRHAQATEVDLTIEASDRWVRTSIEDNGRGFDPETPAHGHLGLRIMRERAACIAGNLRIESVPGRGTRVQLDIPRRARPTVESG